MLNRSDTTDAGVVEDDNLPTFGGRFTQFFDPTTVAIARAVEMVVNMVDGDYFPSWDDFIKSASIAPNTVQPVCDVDEEDYLLRNAAA